MSLPPADARLPPPYGVLGSLAWGAAGIAAWFITQFVVIIAMIAIAPGSIDAHKLATDGFLLALVTIIAGPAWVGISVLASRLRGWRARDYLALVAPRRGEIVVGVVALGTLLIAFDLLTLLVGRDVVPTFMREAYLSARTSGSLVPFFIAVVIVSPITEEIAFRGFLFRGLSESWIGVAGTIALTSIGWAVMHVQYDWTLMVQIVLIGLVLGWLRWASGSALLAIGLHMAANFVASVQTAIKVEWLS